MTDGAEAHSLSALPQVAYMHNRNSIRQATTSRKQAWLSDERNMESKVELAQEHAEKVYQHHRDYDKTREQKGTATGAQRSERHSGTGHPINEGPKKEGGGKGNWGSYKDDIEEAKEEGLIH